MAALVRSTTELDDDSQIELLFFDTFTHENTEDLNLDLVQFPCAVFVHEVRVIPLGTRVVADFPGGVRLGATNPSSFKLELFVNNLGQRYASTFEKLGLLEYNANVDIQLKIDTKIPTDGLIIKGWYQTITLAVYGSLTTVVQSRASPPPPPPPNVKSKLHTIVPSGADKGDIVGQVQSVAAAQRAALERTSEWAEQQAAAALALQQGHSSPLSGVMASPRAESPQLINPREIPLDHRGSISDQPRDPRDRGVEEELGRRDSREGVRQSKTDSVDRVRGEVERDFSREGGGDLDKDRREEGRSSRRKNVRSRSRSLSPSQQKSPTRKSRTKSPESSSIRDEEMLGIGTIDERKDGSERNENNSRGGGENIDQLLCGLSDTEAQDGEDNFSQISSNEDGLQSNIGEWDNEDSFNYGTITSFNPYQCDLAALETFTDPSLTAYEIEKQTLVLKKDKVMPLEATRLLDIVDGFRRTRHHEKWVEAMESVPSLIIPGLVYLVHKTDHKDVLEYLVDWALEGLDFDKAVEQPEPAYKLRHMKMGIAVAGALCNCDSYIAFRMLSREVQHKLLDLYSSQHMSTSIKLQILYALDQTTSLKEGLDWFVGRHHLQKSQASGDKVTVTRVGDENSAKNVKQEKGVDKTEESADAKPTGYQRLIDLMMGKQLARPLMALTALARKVHIYEVLLRLMTSVDIFVEGVQASNSECKVAESSSGSQLNEPLVAGGVAEASGSTIAAAASNEAAAIGSGTAVAAIKTEAEGVTKSINPTENTLDDVHSPDGAGSDELAPPGEQMEVDDAPMMDADMTSMILDPALEEELVVIIQCLEEITRILADADNLIGQPKRVLPNKVRFEVLSNRHNASRNLYHMFNSCRLLESVFVLLSCPVTSNHSMLFCAIKNLLTLLLECHSGLLYLSFRVDTVNGILRALTQNADYSQGDERELSSTNQLGLTMIYYLQALQHVDQLCEYKNKNIMERDLDEADILGVLHSLYSMTFTSQGREAVVHVFTLEDNLATLMTFIEFTGNEVRDSRIRHSVCFGYAVMMIAFILHHSQKVDWIEKFGHKLLSFADIESKQPGKADDKITEILEWLQPIKTILSFSHDSTTVQELMNQLKQFTDDFGEIKEVLELPKGMITVLRVLQYLSIEPTHSYTQDEFRTEELKYRYVLTEIYGANAMPMFISILQKMKDILLFPWQIGFPQSVTERSIVLSIVRPVLSVMRVTLSHLIAARGSEYKDLTCIPYLMDIHTILCSISPTGILSPDLQQVQTEIVDAMMAFTQPRLISENSEEALSQSLWSGMLKEVLKYTMTAPYTNLSGLIMISEMLPLPLPIQSKETLSTSELMELINCRKRWSAYLHPHVTQIQNIIRCLSGTSCQPLHQLLRRVCWQLADLAVPAALAIVRSMLDTLLEAMDNDVSTLEARKTKSQEAVDSDHKQTPFSCTPTARILNLFAFLMNQAAVKAAFLYLPRSGVKTDEKYVSILARLIELFNVVSEEDTDTQAQESIVSIFQSLCDVEINLTTSDGRLATPELMQRLANGLPAKDQLSQIAVGLLKHIDNRDQRFSSILPSLRTLTLLMDHDYGFYHVKQAMKTVPTAFRNLFSGINATFSKDSSDCIATLSSAAECIQFLMSPPLVAVPPGVVPAGMMPDELSDPELGGVVSLYDRKLMMSNIEIGQLLSWNGEVDHPLYELDALLCDYAKDEETLKPVYESVHALVSVLQSEDEQTQRPEINEPIMPTPESLSIQFSGRTVYLITDDEDDRLSATYWLSTPMGDESENEHDLVKINLIELATRYCPELDLEAELKKGSTTSELSALPKRKKRITAVRRGTDTINTSRQHGNGGFVAPMRGRGFGRGGGGMGGGGGRSDMFRSRPPNTSRPPSMHVDDFNKIEMGHQPSNAFGSMQPPQVINSAQRHPEDVNRGQMFDRGGGRGNFRGRFFAAGSYGHRDGGMTRGGYNNNRGGMSMSGGANVRVMQTNSRGGGMMVRGTATGPPMMGGAPKVVGGSQWGGRTNQRPVYGSGGGNMPQGGFGPGGGPGMQNPIERRREDGGGAGWYGGGGPGWQDAKDRQPDQRYITRPYNPYLN